MLWKLAIEETTLASLETMQESFNTARFYLSMVPTLNLNWCQRSEFCNLFHEKNQKFNLSEIKFNKTLKCVSHQVLPSIVPFGFGEEQFNLDDSVTTVCSVVKGDLPLTIWWSFEDVNHASVYNITTNDGIIITRSSQKVSMLMIEAVKARHRGNYTCYAQNRGGLSAQSAYLAINGNIIKIPNRKSLLLSYHSISEKKNWTSTIRRR